MKKKNYKKINIGNKFKIQCLLPIRLNSARIKNKNFVKINNIPLIEFVINKIKKSKYIDTIYLAAEKLNKVKGILKKEKKIKFFLRSKRSAKKNCKTEVVIKEFLKKNDLDILVLVQATNPFIEYSYLDKAIEKLILENFQSLLSVVKSKHFTWANKKFSKPINYNLSERKMSQNMKGYLVENGSFYIFYKKNFLKYNNRLHGSIGTYEMPKESLHEIDDNYDLEIVRKLLK